MKNKSATEKLKCYIAQNHLSISDISKNTGVEKGKLANLSTVDFDATEFLAICCFLNVNPRIFSPGGKETQ